MFLQTNDGNNKKINYGTWIYSKTKNKTGKENY